MSEKNVINKIIKENYKINEIERSKEESTNNNKMENNNDDKSFKQLHSLQLLIQKHSGLKELCKT